MQTFGMIVTAETLLRREPAGQHGGDGKHSRRIDGGPVRKNIEAKYELLGRGTYSATNTKIQDAIFRH